MYVCIHTHILIILRIYINTHLCIYIFYFCYYLLKVLSSKETINNILLRPCWGTRMQLAVLYFDFLTYCPMRHGLLTNIDAVRALWGASQWAGTGAHQWSVLVTHLFREKNISNMLYFERNKNVTTTVEAPQYLSLYWNDWHVGGDQTLPWQRPGRWSSTSAETDKGPTYHRRA